MFIESADATGGHDREVRTDPVGFLCQILHDNARTLVFTLDDIDHRA